jgi:alkanesulfonate monooxygenase SsuD/methylene tetrahydromethanopterin reductase-like flavin-dependent oxidoreductase (luciferase family)
VELGIYTFAELTPDSRTGETISAAERLRNLIEEMELADQVGLDVFGVGEHHRPDFAVSSPAVVLAAGAERTKRIRLTSAVSVLSSDEPVRVFQDFATLDLLSGGRAEIMAGRGAFIESFPLFGFDLHDYDELFEEKLRLLLALRDSEVVTWPGSRHRAGIDGLGVYPQPLQKPLPVWVAVGGAPESAVRAGALGLPMALAIIGRLPERCAPGRARAAGALDQLARLHRRDVPGRSGCGVAAVPGTDDEDRPRTRLAAGDAGAVRRRPHPSRRALRRQPGRGHGEDPLPARDLRARPLPAAAERRHDAAPRAVAGDRAFRHGGRTCGTRCAAG